MPTAHIGTLRSGLPRSESPGRGRVSRAAHWLGQGSVQETCRGKQAVEFRVLPNGIQVSVPRDKVQSVPLTQGRRQKPERFGTVARVLLRGQGEDAGDLIQDGRVVGLLDALAAV